MQSEEQSILEEFSDVFSEELGKCTGPPVSVTVDPAAKPKFLKSRSIPFAIRSMVDEEIQRLVKQDVLEPVQYSEWATPIVPVLKKNGEIRLCGDYKCTVNPAMTPDTYPLPTSKELFVTLTGGKRFSRLDLAQAYQQLPLDEKTARLLTINTPKGLFKVKRLPFGITAAPGIFQRFLETILSGIPGVVIYLDDILLMGRTVKEHNERLREVLKRLQEHGLHVNIKKCKFGVPSVEFLGFEIDEFGIHPTTEKVRAIQDAPIPKNKTELKSFLGLLNFYSCFMKNRASVLEPLHRLLDEKAPFIWNERHSEAFAHAKKLVSTSDMLTHYDEGRPLILACDASPCGIGAVISHVNEDGSEAPIAFASRTLAPAERNYAQIDREGLAIIYGVTHFHQYLYGRSFQIFTDHKPLLGLFNPTRQTPQVVSPRVLRWSLLLSSYSYTIHYRPGTKNGNADALSRLPLPDVPKDVPEPADILFLEDISDNTPNAKKVATLTRRDVVLSKVLLWVLHGWPEKEVDPIFKPYVSRREELTTHEGTLLWGSRVVIPEKMRKDVLTMFHSTHPGMVHMKSIARGYVWWPGMDGEIEDYVKQCDTCQTTRDNPPEAQKYCWEWPENPWSRLHVDFAGPFQGKIFLIVIDAHSKWLEVFLVNTTSSHAVIDKLRPLFATHGVPDMIVSDNGTAFTSTEFSEFLRKNGIKGVTIAPYNPAANGQAERAVKTTKLALKQIIQGDWSLRLARFLLSQHVTPHSTTGVTPAELLMGRKLKTSLDKLQPDMKRQIRNKQFVSLQDTSRRTRMFKVGDTVYAKNFGSGTRWIPATIIKVTGPVSYIVCTEQDQTWRRHVNQLRSRVISLDIPETDSESARAPQQAVNTEQANNQGPTLRRTTRVHKRPQYLSDYDCSTVEECSVSVSSLFS